MPDTKVVVYFYNFYKGGTIMLVICKVRVGRSS